MAKNRIDNYKLIKVKVIPNAKKTNICKYGEELKIYLTAPAIKGKANKALIEILAQHFSTKKSNIEIAGSKTSRNKIIKLHS